MCLSIGSHRGPPSPLVNRSQPHMSRSAACEFTAQTEPTQTESEPYL